MSQKGDLYVVDPGVQRRVAEDDEARAVGGAEESVGSDAIHSARGASTSRAHPRADFTTDISVIDAATGAVRSRATTVRADRIVRQGDELIGGGPTSRVVFAITRE